MDDSIKVDWQDFERLAKDLRICAKRSIPHAVKNGLNDAAFEGRKMWQHKMGEVFTIRNQYTQRGVRVVKAQNPVGDEEVQSAIGSNADYLPRQEKGGLELPKSGSHIAFPTRGASGESASGMTRRRIVRKNVRHNVMQPQTTPAGKYASDAQRTAVALRLARKNNNRLAIVTTRKGTAVVFVGRRLIRAYSVKSKKQLHLVRKLWDYSRSSVAVKPHETLQPTMRAINKRMPRIMIKSMHSEMKRAGFLALKVH